MKPSTCNQCGEPLTEVKIPADQTKPLTIEQKLQAIIAAQVKGRYSLHDLTADWMTHIVGALVVGTDSDGREFTVPVLEILFDPKGLKAAYGEDDVRSPCYCGECPCGQVTPAKDAAHRILDAWLSGGAENAINAAYDLLP